MQKAFGDVRKETLSVIEIHWIARQKLIEARSWYLTGTTLGSLAIHRSCWYHHMRCSGSSCCRWARNGSVLASRFPVGCGSTGGSILMVRGFACFGCVDSVWVAALPRLIVVAWRAARRDCLWALVSGKDSAVALVAAARRCLDALFDAPAVVATKSSTSTEGSVR